MSKSFSFSVDHRSYSIDDNAYKDEKLIGTFFTVKKCPRCKKINSPEASICDKCNGALDDDSIFIASRVKRTGLGLWIGTGLWGLIVALFSLVSRAKVMLGAIPTVLILGGCMYVGKLIAGRKIVVDSQASLDYQQYRRMQAIKESLRETSDPEEIRKFTLTETCPHCNAMIESDCVYCSNCGQKIGKKVSDVAQSKPASAPIATTSVLDEEYIKYIMSNNPSVTRDDVIAFLSVLDIYDNTTNKDKALEAFDSFINQLANTNPMHAMMVNGFFCGLLGSNISLSKTEVDALAKKNTPLIISKINSQSK